MRLCPLPGRRHSPRFLPKPGQRDRCNPTSLSGAVLNAGPAGRHTAFGGSPICIPITARCVYVRYRGRYSFARIDEFNRVTSRSVESRKCPWEGLVANLGAITLAMLTRRAAQRFHRRYEAWLSTAGLGAADCSRRWMNSSRRSSESARVGHCARAPRNPNAGQGPTAASRVSTRVRAQTGTWLSRLGIDRLFLG